MAKRGTYRCCETVADVADLKYTTISHRAGVLFVAPDVAHVVEYPRVHCLERLVETNSAVDGTAVVRGGKKEMMVSRLASASKDPCCSASHLQGVHTLTVRREAQAVG